MKVVKSNLLILLAEKHQREGGKRPSLRSVAHQTGLTEYAVYGFANNTLREYPASALAGLCAYLGCEVGDLLTLADAPGSDETK
jgi:DNA-binding Xre family transcriptional regulator